MATRNPKPIPPRIKDERAFYQAVKRTYADPWFADLSARLASVQNESQALRVIRRVQARIERLPNAGAPVGPTIEQMNDIEKYHRLRTHQSFRQALAVNVGPFLSQPPVRAFMDQRVRESVDLIKTIPRRFHAGLASKLTEQLADKPFDQAQLRKLLSSEYKSSGYNLRRLTRDQTNKAIGGLTEIRQTQLGVTHYRWLTAGDRRVRVEHQANEDVRFAWAQPPGTGHPGQAVQCRCVSVADITPENAARLRGDEAVAAGPPIEQVTTEIAKARDAYSKLVKAKAPLAEVRVAQQKITAAIVRGPVRKTTKGHYRPAKSRDGALQFDPGVDTSKFQVLGLSSKTAQLELRPLTGAAVPKRLSGALRIPKAKPVSVPKPLPKPKPAAVVKPKPLPKAKVQPKPKPKPEPKAPTLPRLDKGKDVWDQNANWDKFRDLAGRTVHTKKWSNGTGINDLAARAAKAAAEGKPVPFAASQRTLISGIDKTAKPLRLRTDQSLTRGLNVRNVEHRKWLDWFKATQPAQGETIAWNAPTSWTLDPKIARNFSRKIAPGKDQVSVVFRASGKSGTQQAQMAFGELAYEAEAIIPAGQKIKILRVVKDRVKNFDGSTTDRIIYDIDFVS